jgi:hypothetical protein
MEGGVRGVLWLDEDEGASRSGEIAPPCHTLKSRSPGWRVGVCALNVTNPAEGVNVVSHEDAVIGIQMPYEPL